MTDTLPVDVAIRWYTPDEGGRRAGPPPGPRYTPTGRFASQPVEEMFSVILDLTAEPSGSGRPLTHATIRPGIPENVPDFYDRLNGGQTLILHEGRRAVGEIVSRQL